MFNNAGINNKFYLFAWWVGVIEIQKYVIEITKVTLNYTIGPETSQNIANYFDLSIPTMQYLTLGSDIKPTDLQDFYIAISAYVAEDHLNIHNTTNELINSVTFKTSIKDPIKMACKTLLLPEELYPSFLRGSACEFLGGITASTITECYNKKSILVNYSNLAIKAIPDSIAKPLASSFKKSAIDHKLDYVSAEAIYRVIGNDAKMLISSIINADNFRKILNPQRIEINEEVTEKMMAPLKNITPLDYFGQNTTLYITEDSFS